MSAFAFITEFKEPPVTELAGQRKQGVASAASSGREYGIEGEADFTMRQPSIMEAAHAPPFKASAY